MGALDRILRALRAAPSVLITGPIGSDGDSLGASLALAHLLAEDGHRAEVTGQPGRRYGFLPGADALLPDAQVGARAEQAPWHTVLVVDGDRERLTPGVGIAWKNAIQRIVIDHHISTTAEGYDLAWIDAAAPSTCQMLVRSLRASGRGLDPVLATLLHTGNVYDTGGFRFDNATPEVLRTAADCVEHGADHAAICTQVLQQRRWRSLQGMARVLSTAERLAEGRLVLGRVPAELMSELDLDRGDLDGIVDQMLFVEGVEVAALLFPQGADTKVSLRSRGRVDVAALAGELSPTGGGHRKASGARTTRSEMEIRRVLEDATRRTASQSGA